MGRLTDNDKNFWIFTYGKVDHPTTGFVISSNGGEYDEDESPPRNTITMYLFGYIIQFYIPNIIEPYTQFINLQGATTKPGVNGYWLNHSKDYGFRLSEDYFQIFYGEQTHASNTEKRRGLFLPWKQWRFVKYCIYDKDLNVVFESLQSQKNHWDKQRRAQEAVEKMLFEFVDFDGKIIEASTYVEERTWKFGEGWFKWLSWFRKDLVRRDLSIELNAEMGREKGSWKGGITGTSIIMEALEKPEAAFRRWCSKDHGSKSGKYNITFLCTKTK